MKPDTWLAPLSCSDQATLFRDSTVYCRRVTRKHAQNFYYGLMLTPEPKRSAMYAVYAWMRAADDLADASGPVAPRIKSLEVFRRQTDVAVDPSRPIEAVCDEDPGTPCDPIWPAVRKAVFDFEIPVEYLHAMLRGQQLDQKRNRYETFDELYDYCYHVASVVGLVCVTIWGYQGGQETLKLAEYRGVALQLTNILRDLVEDALRGRVYLPAAELKDFGYDSETFLQTLLARQAGHAFDDLVAQQVGRAQSYYQMSAGLEDRIDRSCRPTSWAMMQIYQQLLLRVLRRPRLVLAGPVRLGRLEKLGIAMRAIWTRGISG